MPIGIPLSDDREERYAQARAKLIPSRQACVQAGWSSPHNAARVERRKRVQARIRELRYHDEVDIAWQRRVLRQELMAIAMLRMPDLFVETVAPVLDRDGNPTGEMHVIERRMRPFSEWTDEEKAAVGEFYTDKDGIERLKAHSKIAAIEMLCKLDGLVEPDVIMQFNQQINQGAGGEVTTVIGNARDRIAGRIERIAGRTVGEATDA